MAKGYTGRTEIEKDFIKAFNRLSYRHNPWTVWQNFINMAASPLKYRQPAKCASAPLDPAVFHPPAVFGNITSFPPKCK